MTSGQTANVFGNDNIVVQAMDGKVIIGSDRRNLTLTLYADRAALAAETGSEVSLLSAYRDDVVPLLGRTTEFAALGAWLASDRRVSVRVLTGSAGRGKTRLAVELARSVAEDWHAGFVGAEDFEAFCAARRSERWAWKKDTLVVFDYAASLVTALNGWLKEIIDTRRTDRPKLRLLLLERQAQRQIGWLSELVGRGENDESLAKIALLDPPEPVALEPLDGLEFRREVFAAMLKRKGLAAPQIGEDPIFERHLREHKWGGDPLFLMMAGLVAGEAGVAAALSLSRAELADKLAIRELDRIGRIGAARGIDRDATPRGRFLRRIAALATLVQGASAEAARALAVEEARAVHLSVDLEAVVGALGEALPASEAGKAIGPILPDIVGEAALLAVFGDGGEAVIGGVAAAPRIAAAARTSLKAASATLVRAAQDFAGAGRLEPVAWLDALAESPDIDLGALMEIANALPNETSALREPAVRLFEKILKNSVELQKNSPEADLRPMVSSTLNNLGIRLRALGRHEDAVKAAEESVAIRSRLAAERPDAYLPDLAKSLNNLGACYGALGRHEDALKAVEEGRDIYCRLAAARPNAFLPDLAGTLNNLGAFFGALGRREDALKAEKKAVVIRCRLAAERPDAYLPDLAKSLNNLGNRFSDLGRHQDALKPAEKARDIYRRLATERPDTFFPDLAMSLKNLSIRFGKLGRLQDALKPAEEARDIYRRLAAVHPDAFLPGLAASLGTLGDCFEGLGLAEDSLVAIQQAVQALAGPFLKLPRKHAQWMRMMRQQYIERCEALRQEPDAELLAPIIAALQSLQPS